MSRIRSIHPGWFTDEVYVTLSPLARILQIGLWTEADDHGVFEWKPVGMKMKLLPVENCDVVALMDELAAAHVVQRVFVGGKAYGLIRNFCTYQKAKHPSYRHPFLPDWVNYVGWKGASPPAQGENTPSAPPPLPVASPTERRGEERRVEEKQEGCGEGAHTPSGLQDLLGTRMDPWWEPKDETWDDLVQLVPSAEALDEMVTRFVTTHVERGTMSKDWDHKFATELRAALPKPRKRAPPAVHVDKHDTRPPPGVIGQPAHDLAVELCAKMGVPETDALAYDMRKGCQRWMNAGIDATVISTAIMVNFAETKKLPDRSNYYDRIVKRAHDEVSSGSVTADTHTAGTRPNGRRSIAREPSYAEKRLAALTGAAGTDPGGPQDAQGDSAGTAG